MCKENDYERVSGEEILVNFFFISVSLDEGVIMCVRMCYN